MGIPRKTIEYSALNSPELVDQQDVDDLNEILRSLGELIFGSDSNDSLDGGASFDVLQFGRLNPTGSSLDDFLEDSEEIGLSLSEIANANGDAVFDGASIIVDTSSEFTSLFVDNNFIGTISVPNLPSGPITPGGPQFDLARIHFSPAAEQQIMLADPIGYQRWGSWAQSHDLLRHTGLIGGAQNRVSPLVFDFGDDGLSLSHFSDVEVFFDIDGDGFAEDIGWVGPTEGELAIDVNGNGLIDDITELFGNDVSTAYEKLSTFDSNGDSWIDENDADFHELLIWHDRNTNGVSEFGELTSIIDSMVSRISTQSVDSNFFISENYVSDQSVVELHDGSQITLYDVHYVNNNINTREYFGITSPDAEQAILDFSIIGLPNSRGYGSMSDLHFALSRNDELKEAVLSLKTLSVADINLMHELVDEILFRWAGVYDDDVTQYAELVGNNVDARKINFIESFTGVAWAQRGFTELAGQDASAAPLRVFNEIHSLFAQRFAVQSFLESVFPNASYSFDTDDITLSTSLPELEARISPILTENNLSQDANMDFGLFVGNILVVNKDELNLSVEEIGQFVDQAFAIDSYISEYDLNISHFPLFVENLSDEENLLNTSTRVGEIGADTIIGQSYSEYIFSGSGNDYIMSRGGDDFIFGDDGEDTIFGEDGIDRLFGGSGGDVIYGGDGRDIIHSDSGEDIIYGGLGNDNLDVGDVSATTVYGGDGLDIVHFSQRSEGVYVLLGHGIEIINNNVGQQATIIEGVEGVSGSSHDDTILGASFERNFINGEGGDDRIFGGWDDDFLWGATGDDTLGGGPGNDVLQAFFGSETHYGGAGVDTLAYDHGFIEGGVIVDLSLGIGSGGEASDDVFSEIENLVGTYYFDDQLSGDGAPNSINGLGGNDIINGASGGDVLVGDAGSDTLSGDEGSDVLVGGADSDLLYGGGDDDTLIAGGADDDLFGGSGDDTLEAGSGTDDLAGGTGNDTYRVDRTDGNARISSHQGIGEGAGTGEADIVVFEDISFDEIDLTHAGSGVRTFGWSTADGTGSLTTYYGCEFIEEFQFADGTSFEAVRVLEHDTGSGSYTGDAKGEWIVSAGSTFTKAYGGAGDDIIDVSDELSHIGGGSGDDIYRFDQSDGDITFDLNLTKSENATSGTNDRIVFTDLDFSDVALTLVSTSIPHGGRYEFTWDTGLAGHSGSITSFYSSEHFEGYDFADGTSFGKVAFVEDLGIDDPTNNTLMIYNGNTSSEWVISRDGKENIFAGDDDDYIDAHHDGGGLRYGGDGNDTFIVGADRDDVRGGDGNDLIVLSGDRIEYDIVDDGLGVLTVSKVLGEGVGNLDDVVREVEFFRFDDGEFSLAEVLDTAPIATDDHYITDEATLVVEDLMFNDRSLSGEELTIVAVNGTSFVDFIVFDAISEQGRTGAAIVSATGEYNFAFDPNGNFDPLEIGETDTVNLTYTISDGTEEDQANISVIVEGLSAGLVRDGSEADDGLYGSSFADVLRGHGGNDIIKGYGGDDTMDGGTGDDRIYVTDIGDVVIERANEGYDRIYTSVSYTLSDHVEAAAFEGVDGITVTGNELNNWFTGNDGNDMILGLAGADRLQGGIGGDTLDGGTGNDVLEGQEGVDRFIFRAGDGTDRITDFDVAGGEIVEFHVAGLEYSDLTIFNTSYGALVQYDAIDPSNNQITFTDVDAMDLQAAQFSFV